MLLVVDDIAVQLVLGISILLGWLNHQRPGLGQGPGRPGFAIFVVGNASLLRACYMCIFRNSTNLHLDFGCCARPCSART